MHTKESLAALRGVYINADVIKKHSHIADLYVALKTAIHAISKENLTGAAIVTLNTRIVFREKCADFRYMVDILSDRKYMGRRLIAVGLNVYCVGAELRAQLQGK